jgi:oligopeptide/dipeptide ABC transporter ATP-binding protein
LLFIFTVSVFPQNVRVTILHVNDVYQFIPVEGGKRGGLGRLLTLKKQALAENPNTIFTLGGDTLSPSVETRTYKGAQMIDAWNAVGLDYAVLGNHEFDIKTPDLLLRLKESKFTWLGANVIDTKTNKIFADLPNPALLIADEPTTALDVTTQAQIIELMQGLQDEFGMAMIFITHDLGVVAEIADEVAVMYLGIVVERGDVDQIFHEPKHPYTRALLSSIPRLGEASRERLASIRGMVPDPYNRPPGCPFNTRCDFRIEGVCDRILPPTTHLGYRRDVRCLLYEPEYRNTEQSLRIHANPDPVGAREGGHDGTGE